MGSLEHEAGDHQASLVRFHQARELLSVEPVNKQLISSLNAQEGRCLTETGHIEEGKPLVIAALRDRESVYGLDHPTLAPLIDILREINQYQGKFVEAKVLAERALAIRRRAYGPFHPDISYGEADMARILAELGDSKGSLQHAIESDRTAREHLALNVAKLAEREATLFVLQRFSAVPFAVSAAVDAKGDTIAPAFDTLIRSRAMVFDELASRHGTRIAPSEDAESIYKLTEELHAARERLSRLAVGSHAPDEELLAAIEDRDAVERKLAASSVEYRRRISSRSAGLKEVAMSLPEDASLISYVKFAHASKGTIKEPDEYAAFVLSKGATIIVALGPAVDIDAAVDELRAKLAIEAAAPGIAAKRNEAAYRAAADNLRKLVWDPIDRSVSASKRIFIVTDGSLYAVNFAALPEPGADNKYLIERPALFHYLSAERDLVTSKANESVGIGLLAVGNPSFDRPELARGPAAPTLPGTEYHLVAHSMPVLRGARSTCAGLQSMQFAPLPSSEVEIDNISHIWKQSPAAGGEVVELTGDLAGPSRFKAFAPGKRTIHLAVHGFVAGVDCTDPVRNENPLLLTGLALAGANHHDAIEDGILTADEIGAMDLRGVEWAVLSACDTGLGKATQAEGVFGLRRAFQVAGVHTVIMSLWPVEDHVTTEWMRLLYDERLNHHMDTASAVHYASLETLKHRRSAGQGTHPFYWAPFVAAGDWR
jgi:CHAT domain-containing protein